MPGLKKELSVSGHTVIVEVDDEVISQGDRVQGTLTVIPQGERELGDLDIRMREYHRQVEDAEDTLTTRTRTRTHEQVTLVEFESRTIVRKHQFSVQLEQARCYSFSLKLPRNCRPSTAAGGWQLSVSMPNESGLYPDTDMVRLNVSLGEEMQAILDTFVGLKFVEDPSRRSWDSRSLVTQIWLNPPKVLAGELDGVALELRQGDAGTVEGSLIFDLQEKSVADYLKSLVQQDLVRRELSDVPQLFLEGGHRNAEGLSKMLGDMLNGVLTGR
jgi:hypothetical protein